MVCILVSLTMAEEQAKSASTTQNVLNINGIGEYDGKSILDIDMDNVADKGWRRPGDYFEDTIDCQVRILPIISTMASTKFHGANIAGNKINCARK